MKLINCHIYAFGNLKDFSYDFSDGLNTIKEENGWGKSTLAAFIKAIFYGLNGDNKKNLAENERHKYKPWNSTEKFGGSVVFEWKGKSYKLERFFGNKQSEDTVRIFDVETGKQFPNTENLGKRIFGIDEEGFLSTTYLSQKDFEVKSNTSITAKYNEVCEMQDADIFDKAVGYRQKTHFRFFQQPVVRQPRHHQRTESAFNAFLDNGKPLVSLRQFAQQLFIERLGETRVGDGRGNTLQRQHIRRGKTRFQPRAEA